jgi:polyhydroxyalkanoate synthesis repressor PhaR
MVRLIKRYESRKLYDTEESRYVSLQDLADFIREGQEIRVIDNATSADVTAQTLTQLILDEGRTGRTRLPTELLHDLVRFGEETLSAGVEQVQTGVDKFVKASVDRLGPVRDAREEMSRLRERLERLEASQVEMAASAPASKTAPTKAAAPKKPTAKKPVAKKVARKPAAKKTTRAKTTKGG